VFRSALGAVNIDMGTKKWRRGEDVPSPRRPRRR
jgi:hypothetical protein